ncbi:MAG: (2Fe-2S) ferredoxin domain-containing protein [Bacillota bacterium]|nr:(2Fe-2S) ferredoxin domain-containing protein [Bacillota bacterium]
MKSREDLRRLREEAKGLVAARGAEGTKIIVGMGTCGIAAGAREVMAAILEELNKRNIQATVTQTGCIGMCEKEPLVDVQRPGEKRITYGNVKPADVPRIVTGHVLHGNIVEDLVIARFEEI